MKTYAITGGLGSGKSTLKNWFSQQGVPTLDADQISRDLVTPGQPALHMIAEQLGTAFIQADGQLDRQHLREHIFTNRQAKHTLESILHPMIREETQLRLTEFSKQGHSLAVIEIPLLVETGRPDYIDGIILADCAPSQQIERVQTRNGWSYPQIINIMKQQASRQDRLAIADIIIDTSSDLNSVANQLQKVLEQLKA